MSNILDEEFVKIEVNSDQELSSDLFLNNIFYIEDNKTDVEMESSKFDSTDVATEFPKQGSGTEIKHARKHFRLNQCPHCPRYFKRNYDLENHIQGHTNLRSTLLKSEIEERDSGPEHSNKEKKRFRKEESTVSNSSPSRSYKYQSNSTNCSFGNQDTNGKILVINQLVDEPQKVPAMSKLKHYHMYAFWDPIISSIPREALNDVRFRVTALLQDIINERRTN